jgi:hypothetical protein
MEEVFRKLLSDAEVRKRLQVFLSAEPCIPQPYAAKAEAPVPPRLLEMVLRRPKAPGTRRWWRLGR